MKFLAICLTIVVICALLSSSSWAAPLELQNEPLSLLDVEQLQASEDSAPERERVARGLGLGGFGGLGGGFGGLKGGFGGLGGLGHGFGGGFGGFGGHGFGGGLGSFKGLFNKHF